ncbi:MAG TPA: undecaprenyldiphospho-muramoylpentapeptide beta-N-acetylglucosaminyltransferase [Stellaceae bacterium]|nr:undecaprenyldiphospho-muramoylpentapeptide beta-N-acetylglucosaminyltransferase [Stellaceae bacterium]
MSPIYVLAAGGTGGHLFPAEAVARLLVESGATVHLAADRRADAFAAAVPGVTIDLVRAGRLGGGPLNVACGLAGLALGMMQARRLLRRLAPAAVIGFGGYPSVPTMLAAAQLGLPTLIHEQNAVFGRANRLLAPRARHIATGFAETRGLRPADAARAVQTGNPVRPAIRAVAAAPYAPPGETPGEVVELLVVGGSQGARIFSEIMPPAIEALPAALRARLRLSQQARPEDKDVLAARYAALGVAAEIESFFTDMPARLARAQLVICRAGASTIAELAAAGRPAILVAYPHAMDDHQTANAAQFAAAGGGWAMAQGDATPAALVQRLAALIADPAALVAAAAAARRFARDDAAECLARLAQELAGDGRLERAA